MSRITRALVLASAILPIGLIVSAAVPAAQAQTYMVTTAGSSAQWGVFGAAAYQLAINTKPSGGSVGHYTVKGADSSGNPYAYISDTRNSAINNAQGNIWIIWNQTSGGTIQNVWAYLSIDSTIGVRGFLGHAAVALSSSVPTAGQNLLSVWSDGSLDTALPSTILAAFDSTTSGATTTGVALTAANTDIRPEDALFATERSLSAYSGTSGVPSPNPYNMPSTNWAGLGYGSSISGVGTTIASEITAANAASLIQPVLFGLTAGTADPLKSSLNVPAWTTIPIGAAPIVFLANKTTGSALASATNLTTNQAVYLFTGNNINPSSSFSGGCIGTNVDGGVSGSVYPVLREPTSGTYNTTEYNIFRTSTATNTSQEAGVGLPASSGANPLDQNCVDGGGYRERGTGTGDVVSGVNGKSGGLGYVFFSYEAVPSTDAFRYLQYNSVDPLNSSYTTNNGAIPTCSSTINGNTEHWCPGSFTPGTTFAHVRSNSYPVWSTYRLVTAPSTSTAYTNNLALVQQAEKVAAFDLPDFIPFEPQCSTSSTISDDPGLQEYREHYYWNFGTSSTPIYPAYVNATATSVNDGPNLLGSTGITCSVSGNTYYSWALGGYVSGSSYVENGGDVGGTVVNNASKSQTSPGATPPGVTTERTTY